MSKAYTLQQLADFLGAELQGDPGCLISRLNTLQDGGEGDLSFLANRAYQRYLSNTGASAVILSTADASGFTGNALIHPNPYLAYAQVSGLFDNLPVPVAGRHPSACIDPLATVAGSASVGPCAVVEKGAQVGEDVVIGAGCFVGANVVVGDGSRLMANVTLYHDVFIGNKVLIHSGAVVGSDGFGFAPEKGRWQKIHQLGSVEIGDNVEIGACTTIDRGALGNTRIGNGVIIDNQVQIAHNVSVGDYSALAGCVAIAGSSRVGKHCILAGGVGLVGHITLCDGVTVTARSMVTHSINEPGVYSSGTPLMENSAWKKNAVRYGQLDKLSRRVNALEKNRKSDAR